MKIRFNLQNRRRLIGVAFISPFLVGLLFVFIPALVQSAVFSVNSIHIDTAGYTLGFKGLKFYRQALLEDASFNRSLVTSIINMAVNVPMVIIFSFFVSNILNLNFKGRGLVRSIVFLPVIISSGVVTKLMSADVVNGIITSSPNSSSVSAVDITEFLINIGLGSNIVSYLSDVISRLYEVITASGVPVLIFLAALQTISPSIYEAASIEGATGWECFWKITFPMLSPYILTNLVYAVADSLSSYRSTVMNQILTVAQTKIDYSLSSAMSFLFFGCELAILGIFIFVVSRIVFYYD